MCTYIILHVCDKRIVDDKKSEGNSNTSFGKLPISVKIGLGYPGYSTLFINTSSVPAS